MKVTELCAIRSRQWHEKGCNEPSSCLSASKAAASCMSKTRGGRWLRRARTHVLSDTMGANTETGAISVGGRPWDSLWPEAARRQSPVLGESLCRHPRM